VQLPASLARVASIALSGSLLAASASAESTPVPSLAPEPASPIPAQPTPEPRYISARRPDIVMFYLDDFAPQPRSMWSDPERTPQLARFVNHGLRFDNAIVSTPLCGPSRAGLLTGRYGHANGVVANDVSPYRGDNTLAAKLSKVGYRTVYVGKHINRLADDRPTRAQMDRLAEHWDEFDVMWEDQGKFYDWLQYRKDATVYYGSDPGDHSSRVSAELAVEHIASTPPDQPLFLLISLVDGHVPFTPMRRHEGAAACADIEPWAGPAFNEADVSDKPSHIQALPRLSIEGYDLVARCEQSLTVDWVIGKVTKALREAGRLDDTLQVLTADNGWLMGDHRIIGKSYPYATAVPAYVRWPAELGSDKRVVEEPVTNLDWLPTFCELAGCGVRHADGLSLVPLISGKADRLDRKFLFVELLYDNARYPDDPRARPAYTGVETTLGFSDTRWAFTRYSSGEAELYNLSEDPQRLENLYGRTGYRKITRQLQRFHKAVKRADKVRWLPTPEFD
jgi:arylsulfatase A-like enzyme